MVMDPTIQQAVSDAELESEMERLLANRPMFTKAVPGTEGSIEEGKARAITSTAAELTVYNRETGESSQVIFDAIKARMKQQFPADHPNPKFAGQRVYTLNKDEAPAVIRGNLACPLYYERPMVEALNLGFGGKLCRKPPYFLTEYDVEMHVEKNHARFHELRARAKADAEREEERKESALLRAALVALAQTNKGGRPRKER